MSHGQGKPQNGQGNVREKSGNFVRAHGWTPCHCRYIIHTGFISYSSDIIGCNILLIVVVLYTLVWYYAVVTSYSHRFLILYSLLWYIYIFIQRIIFLEYLFIGKRNERRTVYDIAVYLRRWRGRFRWRRRSRAGEDAAVPAKFLATNVTAN